MPQHPPIFISYRIDDAGDFANPLALTLELAFGNGSVFYDKTKLQGGDEWAKKLQTGVQNAEIVLILIANVTRWLGVKTDEFGETIRRIDDPVHDWVRKEAELARAGGKKIIAVFINEGKFPPAEKLPESLRFLPDVQAHRILTDKTRPINGQNGDVALLAQLITEIRKGKNSSKNHHRTDDDPLDEAIENLGIPKDNAIGCLHLVNCDRIRQSRFFRKTFNSRDKKEHFQFYFIGGCPTEMPASFCKRLIYEIIQDRLDGRQDAISYPFREDADRIKIENLPIGSDLESSRKKFKEYVARRFHFSNTENFEAFIETGVPKLPYDFVTAVFEISEKQWDGDNGEIRQFFEWMLQTFRCPHTSAPTFLFFIVVKIPIQNSRRQKRILSEILRWFGRFWTDARPKQKRILSEILSLCKAHQKQATFLTHAQPLENQEFGDWVSQFDEDFQKFCQDEPEQAVKLTYFQPFEEQDFVDWVAELDVRNPNNALAVTHALAATFDEGSEEDFLFKNEKKFHAKDIEPVQRRIYDKAAK